MANIRHIAWAVQEYQANPSDYGYAADRDILAMDEVHLTQSPQDGFSPSQLHNSLSLREKRTKQFSPKQIRELIAARGFLQVVCNWLDPEQVEDEAMRGRIALVQHVLSEIWGNLG